MDAKKIKFDDLPNIMLTLVTQVQALHDKVDSVGTAVSNFSPTPSMNVMNIRQVSKMLGKSTSTIYKMVASEEIPCYKQGKNLSFVESEIKEWLTTYKKGDCRHTMAMAEKYLERLQ